MTLEMGKRIGEAVGEVEFSSDILSYYAKKRRAFPGSGEAPSVSGRRAHGEQLDRRDLLRGALELPLLPAARVAGPHLMAGNVVLVKHAGIVPQCAIAFEENYGLTPAHPPGLYTNLPISHEHVDHVVDDPRIKGVALTGSVAAGRSVAARAGQKPQAVLDGTGGSDGSSCSKTPISNTP